MKILKLIASILVCQLAGIVGSLATFPEITGWYVFLIKPFFAPPNWLFGPVWITLYLLMGIALWLVWEKGLKKAKKAMQLFAAQLALNSLWSIVFFGFHSPLGGFIVIVLLWYLIFLCMMRFSKISKKAGWLLVPYLAWVSLASLLNFAILLLN
jgi:tryptophan-rich sensory protein